MRAPLHWRQFRLGQYRGLLHNPLRTRYGPFVKFDHDFIGREALETKAKQPSRRKVTFEWNAADVGKILTSLLVPGGEHYKFFDFPLANYSSSSYDKILLNGRWSVSRCSVLQLQ